MTNTQMKILIWSQHFWPESFRINEIAQELQENGHEISVLTGKPNYPLGKIFSGYKAAGLQSERYGQISINRVPLYPRGKGGALNMVLNYLSFIFSALIFAPFIYRGKKFDIIFIYGTSPLIQGLSAIPLKFFTGAKIVTWVQDLWPEDLESTGYIKNKYVLKINEWPAKFLYFFSDRILIQSKGFYDPVLRLAAGRELFYLPNPAEKAVFLRGANGPLPEMFEYMSQGFHIVFAGNIGNNQSIETIVEAACILINRPDITFTIVGDGSRLDFLREKVSAHKLKNIKILGRHPVALMPAIYERADALLVTLGSTNNLSLTIPSKIPAYMASAKPILAAINGFGAEVIKEADCGFTCSACNSRGLADIIEKLYLIPANERLEMGNRGRIYAECNYQPNIIIKDIVKHFRETLDQDERK
ncbi:glycosyltransferase family 4 protein [Polynucleobacter sp. 86C-FISCH]|uniref:glycosyltransferase family 4 protein n=1 Tax=Polynucleobacter sp. 86C-FISCH TaxID=2689101 RepID=UPI001C0BE0C5|nr:glycosyltransferase family 4 protein [Polynucleobacter sp. 86C-FISCH]MBU3596015.1 glycosyltransferase family 4 protein [Polynucleobacter sp. 86C-FISCH]